MKRTRILLSVLFLLGMTTAQGQNCPNCQNLAPTGDMMQITTSGQGYLNTMGTDWHSSHGSPSYNPGSLWMWSYDNNGEGVYYEGFNFTAGHTYCITFDTYTRTHNNNPANAAAGFRVVGTSSMVPFESTSGGDPIPAIPTPSEVIADVNWNTTPMNGWSTYSYTFTAGGNWSQLWFYPYSPTLPQCELTLQNLRICDITQTNPCEFEVYFDYSQNGGCGYQFVAGLGLPAGLTPIQYLWDFGDGTTSTEQNPIHYYASPGGYVVSLTVLVVNEDGECCARKYKKEIGVNECDPCSIISSISFTDVKFPMGATYTATGPASPNFVYLWNFGDGSTGNGHSVSHTYAAAGTYSVELTAYYFDVDKGVCCSKTMKRAIKIKKPGGVIIIDPEAPIEDPGTPIPIGEGKPGTASGTHTDIPEELKERPSDAGGSTINVFPNPTTGIFTVTSTTENIRQVQVTDAQGRAISTVKGDKKSAVISLSSQKTGTYTLSIELESGKKLTQTVVKN